jgi:hypothetical protein
MSEWVVQVAVVVLFALTCGVLAAAWTRGRLGTAAIVVCLLAAATWALTFVAIAAEFRDANSFATCTTGCTTAHYVAAVAFVASPLLIAVAALAMIVARGSRWRLRRARENHS